MATKFKPFWELREERGIEKGIEKEKQNTIIRSWKNGIDMPMISNITGVSVADIEKVIVEHQKSAQSTKK